MTNREAARVGVPELLVWYDAAGRRHTNAGYTEAQLLAYGDARAAARVGAEGFEIVAIDPQGGGLLARLDRAERDARRLEWLAQQTMFVSFEYGDEKEVVLGFYWPESAPVSSNLRDNIDRAAHAASPTLPDAVAGEKS